MKPRILGVPCGIKYDVNIKFKIHADMQILIHRDGLPFVRFENLSYYTTVPDVCQPENSKLRLQ